MAVEESFRGTSKGVMKIETKNENGVVLSEKYGFTIQEEGKSVLAFDLIDHEELGTLLLFGDQVFALKFWDVEHLNKASDIMEQALRREYDRRGIEG